MPEVATAASVSLDSLATTVVATLASPVTRTMYGKALRDFLSWHAAQVSPPLSRSLLRAYRAHLLGAHYSAASVNQRLSAIRKLILQAGDEGLLPPEQALVIARVEGVRKRAVRLGNWLSTQQAEALINAPDAVTPKGLRDRAILALLVGCGLWRSEVVALAIRHLQRREGRWVLLDLEGKHHRTRTVPVPPWVKAAVEDWLRSAVITEGALFRAIGRGGAVTARPICAQTVFDIVVRYGNALGTRIRPQDLRRTCAKLCRREGGDLEQIQLLLGHSSIQVTEQYLRTGQHLADAPNDRIPIRWQRRHLIAS